MEAIVERIVEKCIQSELIEESQRDWMAYSLQRKFMNFGGFFILVCFGTLVAPLPQVILLNFGLALLREKTNGLHMPTVFSCFITSLFCEYACLYLIDRLQSSTIAAAITLFIVSAMLILILAPCNNSAMHCSNEELRDMKIAVRKRLVLYCLIIPALLLLKPLYSILYIETDMQGQLTCCAASNRVPQLLRSALWNTGEPAILTSGTLAAAGNFDHTEQLLGLAAYKPLRHFSADSPFNYKKKCLLYLPQRRKERTDNRQLADEIVRLVHACCGHALVLFTSYRQMAEVKAMTDGRWPYPTFQAWRNGGRVIQQFKESGNGILFAAGSCWEGIDFPGDMVSLLIIAKLPFPIPDPVSDYERRQYPNLRDYINAEIIPEMQKKLRQGFGRAIRTEQDSCVVAILDERAGIGGRYHDAALAALPICPTTEKIEDVQQFIREQKRPDYFL